MKKFIIFIFIFFLNISIFGGDIKILKSERTLPLEYCGSWVVYLQSMDKGKTTKIISGKRILDAYPYQFVTVKNEKYKIKYVKHVELKGFYKLFVFFEVLPFFVELIKLDGDLEGYFLMVTYNIKTREEILRSVFKIKVRQVNILPTRRVVL